MRWWRDDGERGGDSGGGGDGEIKMVVKIVG